MSREDDYRYGDELSNAIIDILRANGIETLPILTGGREGKRINKIFGDIVVNTKTATLPIEAKRNGAISRSSVEGFQGELYAISEKGVVDDPDRIHLIPRRVINSWVNTYVNGDSKRNLPARGWDRFPLSGQDGIYLSDKDLREIKAGKTLREFIEEIK